MLLLVSRKMASLKKITTRGKAVYLAYDQGLEHGPESDFNDKNVDPLYILDIAKRGKFNGVVFHLGIAEKYNKEIRKSKVPLILKLNGKTKLVKGEPKSAVIASVRDAVRLKASAVGFTIYIGSKYEEEIIEEFVKVRREAHAKGLPVIAWIYPRGGKVKNDVSRENMVYAARTGLEVGADIAKIKYGGKVNDLAWGVKAAGRCKVVVAGGSKKSEREFLKEVKDVKKAGAMGLAIGRNVWQSKDPIGLSKKIREIVFS
jgi:fructose-bisphosphate aldolase, class I